MTNPRTILNKLTARHRGALQTAVASFSVLAVCLMLAGTAQADFGFSNVLTELSGPEGAFSRQAGAHSDLHVRLEFNQTSIGGANFPDGAVRDTIVTPPLGFIGNATAAPTCTLQQLDPKEPAGFSTCPVSSQIGLVEVGTSPHPRPGERPFVYSGLYNMAHGPNMPAVFGFNFVGAVVEITPKVEQGDFPGGYRVTAVASALSQAKRTFWADVSLWGVPADKSHDAKRQETTPGSERQFFFNTPSPDQRKPFLSNPTSCPGVASGFTVSADSWQEPGDFVTESLDSDGAGVPYVFSGCEQLSFEPSAVVKSGSHHAEEPTSLNVAIEVPQNQSPDGLASAEVRTTKVTFPTGMSISPSAAAGQGACSLAEIGLGSNDPPSCPSSSRLGTVSIKTPLLEEELEGDVILAKQTENPFGTLLAMYLAIKGPGFYLKLPGKVEANPDTGQLTASFADTPQLPFEHLQLSLRGGANAPLVTPPACGTYSTQVEMTSWASPTPVSMTSPMTIDEGCGAGGFAPGLEAGTVNPSAGGSSPFLLRVTRNNGEQNIAAIDATLPKGLLAKLAGVPVCGDGLAAAGACPASSQIGTTTVGAGAGGNPLYIPEPGKAPTAVYLAGPYKGGPYSIVVKVPAQAGPFDLGNVVVRAAIYIDPHTAQVTVASDPLPQILEGIPLAYRDIRVEINRNDFTINPTSCEPMKVDSTIFSATGASATPSSRFQAADCSKLAFKPKFTVSTQAKSSRANGASLDVKLTSGPSQANVGKVVVQLPKQLPSRLTTIQKACLAATFAANPASCPVGSLVGAATAVTPILAHSLSGPAYLVSHGGAAFPDLVVVLQGEGITVDLTGAINIHDSITSSTFATVPDVPITSFELKLPTGPHSALTATLPASAKGSLCGQKLVMPTTIAGQNGAQIKQSTKITVTGCAKAKKAKVKKAKVKKAKVKKTKAKQHKAAKK
jgi:hypothetical protein